MALPPVATVFSFIAKRRVIFHVVVALLIFSPILNYTICAAAEQETSAAECNGYNDSAYRKIAAILDLQQPELSYDDLQKVYTLIVDAEYCLPELDEIILRLMAKTNPHPRVDQMILIYAARIVGGTTSKIDNVVQVFEKLIANERINLWGIAFVAEALGDYCIDLEEGERLAAAVEQKVNLLIAAEAKNRGESYGYHFLPPPKTELIKNMIARTEPRKKREMSRIYYYSLRLDYTEEQIVSFVNYLIKKGLPAGSRGSGTFKYLRNNLAEVAAGMAAQGSNGAAEGK